MKVELTKAEAELIKRCIISVLAEGHLLTDEDVTIIDYKELRPKIKELLKKVETWL